MDNARLEDQLRGDVSATDIDARERARLRLRFAIADERVPLRPSHPRRRRWVLAAAAALMALALLLVEALLPPGGAGPPRGAASEIRRLGTLAARQEPLLAGPSDFIYQRLEVEIQQITHFLTSGSSFTLDIRANIESWLATDGSGKVITTYESVSFASDRDEAAWEQAGRPAIVKAGDVISEPYRKSGLFYFPVEQLPTEPAELRNTLENWPQIEATPDDSNLLSIIGTVLSQEDLPSDLRHALFEVAASIPGVAVEHGVLDPVGRESVAVSLVDGADTTRLYFDPIDARFLGMSETIAPEGARPGAVDSRAYVARGVVSEVGDRPPA
jgi:hypothetical protein